MIVPIRIREVRPFGLATLDGDPAAKAHSEAILGKPRTAIPIRIREVYGRPLRYVTDPVIAAAITALTGRVTLSDSDIRALGELGLRVEEVSR